MEGWLERTLRGLNSLPTEVTDSLSQIREKGVENRNLAKSIQDEEMALLEELQEAIRTGVDIDESSIKTRADALVQRRKDLSVHMDMQTKAASSIYEKCDHYINALDANAKEINTTLSVTISQQDYSQQKKQKNKKNSSSKDAEQIAFQIPVQHANDFIDPNEPVYCICRQVSFGRMIGCESETCKYEWFHFECVGLKEEPEVWYCDECKAEMEGSSGVKDESAHVTNNGDVSNGVEIEVEADKKCEEVEAAVVETANVEVQEAIVDNKLTQPIGNDNQINSQQGQIIDTIA